MPATSHSCQPKPTNTHGCICYISSRGSMVRGISVFWQNDTITKHISTTSSQFFWTSWGGQPFSASVELPNKYSRIYTRAEACTEQGYRHTVQAGCIQKVLGRKMTLMGQILSEWVHKWFSATALEWWLYGLCSGGWVNLIVLYHRTTSPQNFIFGGSPA